MNNEHTQYPKSTPYQVFLHLMMMVMYYVAIISLVALLVQYINLLFPDQLLGYTDSYDIIRSTSSTLLVTFPVFLLSTYLIRKAFKTHPNERDIAIRRWLIYLTLFIAGISMVVDLVQFVNGFYSGELTLPFFLKLLSVLVVSILTFGYFLWELKKNGITSKQAKALAISSSVTLVAVLGVGFVLAGSPAQQRAIRMDEQRVMDLQAIEFEIGNYWREKKFLPVQVADLERDLYYFELPVDPETQEDYIYEVTGDLNFRLCSTFSAESMTTSHTIASQSQWAHSAGYVCFSREIDPDFFDDEIKQRSI